MVILTPNTYIMRLDSGLIEESYHPYEANKKIGKFIFSFDPTHEAFHLPLSSTLILWSNKHMGYVSLDQDQIGALAYDWEQDLYIWTDVKEEVIKMVGLKYSNNVYSVGNISHLRHNEMVINVKKSVLVWSEVYLVPRLIQTNYDGTGETTLYSNSRPALHLSVDYPTERYYFVDIKDFSLYSIDFNGNNEIFYMKSENLFDDIYGLSVWDNDLYLSNKHLIYKIPELDLGIAKAEIVYKTYVFDKYQKKLPQILDQDFYEIDSKVLKRREFNAFFIKQKPQNFTNKCESNVCSHLCLPISSSYRCICPSGYNSVNESQCLAEKEVKPENKTTINTNKSDEKIKQAQTTIATTTTTQATTTLAPTTTTPPTQQTTENESSSIDSNISSLVESPLDHSITSNDPVKAKFQDQTDLNELKQELLEMKKSYLKTECSCNANAFVIVVMVLIVLIITSNVLIYFL